MINKVVQTSMDVCKISVQGMHVATSHGTDYFSPKHTNAVSRNVVAAVALSNVQLQSDRHLHKLSAPVS